MIMVRLFVESSAVIATLYSKQNNELEPVHGGSAESR